MDEILKNLISEIRKEKKRKFDQTIDLIVNLQKFDIKKTQINFFVKIPFKIKDKKICAFLETKSKIIETITPEEFKKYKEKIMIKKIVKDYDFFISQASIMPKVATVFGRYLGPAGKMPSPQLGIISSYNEKEIEEMKKKINNSLRVKTKEPSIKIAIGKESMKDEEIIENIKTVYNELLKNLPKEKDNIKNIGIKTTMGKLNKIKQGI